MNKEELNNLIKEEIKIRDNLNELFENLRDVSANKDQNDLETDFQHISWHLLSCFNRDLRSLKVSIINNDENGKEKYKKFFYIAKSELELLENLYLTEIKIEYKKTWKSTEIKRRFDEESKLIWPKFWNFDYHDQK